MVPVAEDLLLVAEPDYLAAFLAVSLSLVAAWVMKVLVVARQMAPYSGVCLRLATGADVAPVAGAATVVAAAEVVAAVV